MLPQTFRDAIDFVYRLGYTYLWIDSLCIVQDSVDDWRHEGSKMASVYANATLTLAATKSSGSAEGCFVISAPMYRSRKWSFRDTRGEKFSVHSRSSISHTGLVIGSLPLLKRGWALQERLLSPRMLHFLDEEIVFECAETSTCECSAESGTKVVTIQQPKLWKDLSLHEADRQWREVIVSYTKTAITFETDIFPALQGLATLMPPRMGCYLAGLWERTLEVNLTWYMTSPGQRRRPSQWRAPTWSWASTSGNIEWMTIDWWLHAFMEEDDIVTFITVLDASTSPVTDDPTGEITAGVLILKGRNLWATLHCTGPGSADPEPFLEIQCLNCLQTFPRRFAKSNLTSSNAGVSIENDKSIREDQALQQIHWDYSIEVPGPHHVPAGTEILMMKVEGYVTARCFMSSWLLLRRSVDDVEAFERIGCLELTESCTDAPLEEAYNTSTEMEVKIV